MKGYENWTLPPAGAGKRQVLTLAVMQLATSSSCMVSFSISADVTLPTDDDARVERAVDVGRRRVLHYRLHRALAAALAGADFARARGAQAAAAA